MRAWLVGSHEGPIRRADRALGSGARGNLHMELGSDDPVRWERLISKQNTGLSL